jgi:hypothetical protein
VGLTVVHDLVFISASHSTSTDEKLTSRFPLSLVYRVLDIVFAEGLEAMFRFSLAILLRSEDKLLSMDFEQILSYLQSDLFEIYRVESESSDGEAGITDQDSHGDENWKANEFVRDAYEIRM